MNTANIPPVSALAIHYATMTGNAEGLARQAYELALNTGLPATLHNLSETRPSDLAEMAARPGAIALFIVSTWGDGEPPADACDFHYDFQKQNVALHGLRHAVFGLGDLDYTNYNAFARELDARLLGLGSQALLPRCEADLDFDETFTLWLGQLMGALTHPSRLDPATR
jgi:sulfite reductase (NADPH) flavoprotein alpha-component